MAVAHSILVIACHVIKHGTTYQDLGANYFDERDKEKVSVAMLNALNGSIVRSPSRKWCAP